jgi:hypothetical protein
MRNIFISLVAVLGLSLTAQAEFKADLFVGGSTGGQLVYTKTAVKYTMNNSGVPAGLFLGWKSAKGFYSGLEYTYIGNGMLDAQSPAGHADVSTSHHIGGLKIGYEGSRFGVHAQYNPGDTLNVFRNGATQTNHPDAFYGNSVGAGFNIRFGRWGIDLNYLSHTYTNFDFGAAKYQTINSGSTFNQVTDSNAMINITYMLRGK